MPSIQVDDSMGIISSRVSGEKQEACHLVESSLGEEKTSELLQTSASSRTCKRSAAPPEQTSSNTASNGHSGAIPSDKITDAYESIFDGIRQSGVMVSNDEERPAKRRRSGGGGVGVQQADSQECHLSYISGHNDSVSRRATWKEHGNSDSNSCFGGKKGCERNANCVTDIDHERNQTQPQRSAYEQESTLTTESFAVPIDLANQKISGSKITESEKRNSGETGRLLSPTTSPRIGFTTTTTPTTSTAVKNIEASVSSVPPNDTHVDTDRSGRSPHSSSTEKGTSHSTTTRRRDDESGSATVSKEASIFATETASQLGQHDKDKEDPQGGGDGGLSVLQSAASLLSLGGGNRGARPSSSPDVSMKRQGHSNNSSSLSADIVSSSSSLESSAGVSNNQRHDHGVVNVEEPHDKDVLCGRGRGYFCHPGNRRMLEIVEKNKARYRAANKTKKTEIVRDVTDAIEKGGTRFLKRESTKENSRWYQVSAIEKHKKVCHCLREEKNGTETSSASIPAEAFTSPEPQRSHLEDKSPSVNRGILCGTKRKVGALKQPSARLTVGDRIASEIVIVRPDGAYKVSSTMPRNTSMGPEPRQNDGESNTTLPASQLQSSSELLSSLAKTKSPIGYSNLSGIVSSAHWPRTYDSAHLSDNYGIVMGNPRSSDVLFGQDPGFFTHSGNVHLRRLIQGSVGYPAISAQSKLVLAQRLVAEMKSAGSRFLTRQRTSPPGLWYRVDDIEAETLIYRCLEEEETKMLSVLTGGHDAAPLVTANSNSSMAILQDRKSPSFAVDETSNALATTSPRRTNEPEATKHNSIDRKNRKNAVGHDDASSVSEEEASHDDGNGLATSAKTGLPSPGPYDVICGRGRGNFRHPGNRRMLRMFWNVKAKYNQGTKMQKTMIGRAIVEDITSKGGRFLKRSGKGWEEVEKKIVLRKVCHGIRDIPNDPEKRKRSIVADELEDFHESDSAEPSSRSSVGRTAVWLASEAKAPHPHPLSKKVAKAMSISERRSISIEAEDEDDVTDQALVESKEYKTHSPKKPGASLGKKKVDSRNSVQSSSSHGDDEEEDSVSIDKTTDQGTESNIIDTPARHDVLCGRGRGFFVSYSMGCVILDDCMHMATESFLLQILHFRHILEIVECFKS